ncbi:MAG: T9SS type A sorting domain-containing protein [bacterium]
MKKLFSLFALILLCAASVSAQNVNVSPSPATYPTLKDAFDAINAGTHTGAVTVDIVLGTTETATAALNASGTGSASYTSVVVTTSNGAGVTVGGALGAAAIVRLIGADNVTIDGRIGGSGRNITISNTGTTANTTCVWLSNGSSATDSAGAKNNVIRNCEMSTGVLVSVSANNSFGILAGSSVIGNNAGRNNDSNQYLENRIIQARYGILLHGGAAVNRSDNNTITGNIIGPDVGGLDNIGKVGIFAQFQDNCLISQNLVQNVGGTFAGTTGGADRVGIGAGSESWASTPTTTTGGNYTVTQNKINNVTEGRTFSAIGILCASTRSGVPTNNVVANNEIYNIIANGTLGDACWGIGHSGNTSGDLVVYNSIYMTGDLDPAPAVDATQTCGGIRVAVLGDSNTTVKNNSIYVDLTSNNAALLKVCIQMPSATYQFGPAELDNNDYYPGSPAVGPNPEMRLGALGITSLATTFVATLAAWQTTFTPVAQDANSITADPIYCLTLPNFLIPCTATSPLLAEADPIPGITNDILGEPRSAFFPTIGAYEFDSAALPVELSALTASVNNRDVTLNWTTASELNNSGFDIERRLINSEWSRVGNVEGHGTVTSPQNYTFTDRGLTIGKYNYRLKQIDINGNFEYFNLSNEIGIGVPSKYDLSQNYPNPFNPATKISYDLPVDGKVSLKIFDMTGREVATLVNDVQTAGYYTINYNAISLSSGVYFYTITSNNFVATKKMILVK